MPPAAANEGPVTSVSISRQVKSLSNTGSVAVNQSTIFRSPVDVVCSAGLSRSTPESMMPIVTPRPSHVGWAFLKATAPVSLVGMNGLTAGVSAPGAATAAAAFFRDRDSSDGSTFGSGTTSSRSIAATPEILAARSTAPMGTWARTYPTRSWRLAMSPPSASSALATSPASPLSVATISMTVFSLLALASASRSMSCAPSVSAGASLGAWGTGSAEAGAPNARDVAVAAIAVVRMTARVRRLPFRGWVTLPPGGEPPRGAGRGDRNIAPPNDGCHQTNGRSHRPVTFVVVDGW